MNLLVVSDRFSSGGLETHLNTLLKELKEKYSYRLYFAGYIEDTKQSKDLSFIVDEIIHLPKFGGDYNKYLLVQKHLLEEIVTSYPIDVVCAHPFTSYISSFLVSVKYDIPMSLTIHGKVSLHIPIKELASFFFYSILPNTLVFTVNKSVYQNAIYLPNPIDETLWRVRETDSLSKDHVLIVSRLDDDKAFSVSKAIEKLQNINLPILVAGDGNKIDELRRSFPNVKFLGNLNSVELRNFMLSAIAVVGMGRIVLEAAFLQKPCILLTYNGNLVPLDDTKFERAEKFNFNGTNFLFEDDSAVVDRIKSGDLPVVSPHLLRKFRSEEVAKVFNDALVNYVNNFSGFSRKTKSEIFLIENISRAKENIAELKKEVEELKKSISDIDMKAKYREKELVEQISSLKKELNKLKNERDSLKGRIEELELMSRNLEKERDYLNKHLSMILYSRSWKLISRYYKMKIFGKKLVEKVNRVLRTSGKNFVNEREISLVRKVELLKKNTKNIFVFPPTVCWKIPLYQRPHQFAVEISKRGYGFIFCSPDRNYDGLDEATFIQENLLLTDEWHTVVSCLDQAILLLPSTNSTVSIEDLKLFRDRNWRIVYDYIDEIDDIIASNASFQKERHDVINDETVDIACAVSRKLYEELLEKFKDKEKVIYLPNACDFNHFNVSKKEYDVPASIKHVVEEGKPIIGYYGALAKWIDYDLINLLAKKRPQYNILLIGADYDGSMKKLDRSLKNLYIHPPVDYKLLPKYAVWFDVSIIPFVKGNIAAATSPIKLYEYMALGKPIVCTGSLTECMFYKSPLIAEDYEEFIKKVDKALSLREDETYLSLLKKEALENTWASRVDDLLKALGLETF